MILSWTRHHRSTRLARLCHFLDPPLAIAVKHQLSAVARARFSFASVSSGFKLRWGIVLLFNYKPTCHLAIPHHSSTVLCGGIPQARTQFFFNFESPPKEPIKCVLQWIALKIQISALHAKIGKRLKHATSGLTTDPPDKYRVAKAPVSATPGEN